MNKVAVQVGTIVGAVAVFALLVSVGYFTQIGISQTFAPAPDRPRQADNRPTGNQPYRGNEYRGGNSAPRDPIPEGESVWEDYPADYFRNTKRLEDRPGNLEVMTLTGDFFTALYQVEPSFFAYAYPFNANGGVILSKESQEAENAERVKRIRETGRKERNKFRSYNFVFHKVTLQNFGHGENSVANPAELGLDLGKVDRFAEVRKAHPERCVLVLVRASLESLRSDKVEGNASDSDFILCWVKKQDGWKLAWFEK